MTEYTLIKELDRTIPNGTTLEKVEAASYCVLNIQKRRIGPGFDLAFTPELCNWKLKPFTFTESEGANNPYTFTGTRGDIRFRDLPGTEQFIQDYMEFMRRDDYYDYIRPDELIPIPMISNTETARLDDYCSGDKIAWSYAVAAASSLQDHFGNKFPKEYESLSKWLQKHWDISDIPKFETPVTFMGGFALKGGGAIRKHYVLNPSKRLLQPITPEQAENNFQDIMEELK